MKTWFLIAAVVFGLLMIGGAMETIADQFLSKTTQWMLLISVVTATYLTEASR
jgi:hypothetical protein